MTSEVASTHKIAFHREKLGAYLRGERILPATLELDITSQCTRTCPECPSSRSRETDSLPLDFVRRLFGELEGQTKGLLLTGGEPTMAPHFRAVLALARSEGFEDIAVVTNGSLLDTDEAAEALLEHASTIRVSAYDWDAKSCGGLEPTLRRIAALRDRIDRAGSGLQIGVSALTSEERVPMLCEVAERSREAGCHWIYFHPQCQEWSLGTPRRVSQEGVLGTLQDCVRRHVNGFRAFFSYDRYHETPLSFEGYHAAHFLLVIGADGKNYLGAEVKYNLEHAIADLKANGVGGFLRNELRLARIRDTRGVTYPAIRSRHRGVLYNDLIERMKQGRETLDGLAAQTEPGRFRFPHIL